MSEDKVYVTTPIYYVNDRPHVGHAYTTIAADVVARYWRRKLGEDQVFLQVGTDEHGAKIADAAEAAGKDPKVFADELAPRFEELWKQLNVSFNGFIRTTDPVHEQYAQEFLTKLHDQGDIYLGSYEGYYCVGCEEYKTETDLVNGRCPLHPTLSVERQKEENYFFKLTKYVDQVRSAITIGELSVLPEERRNEVLARLGGEVRDLSISRQSVSWGIPVPWDEEHTFYVWVEALLNYLSVLENETAIRRASFTPGESFRHSRSVPSADGPMDYWPPTYQFVGKDILWFHAAIWPALLLAAGKPLPKTIFAHGFFTVNGQKMSKTIGNVIDPIAMIDRYGVDATRYLLISAVSFGSDGDLQADRFDEVYTGELANGLGNLLQRTVTLLKRSGLTIEPGAAPSCADVDSAIERLDLDGGLRAAFEIVRDANQRLEAAKPWEMLSDTNHESRITNHALVSVLTTAYRQLETIAAGISPFMPATSEEILSQLRSLEPKPLFPRLNP